MSERAEKQNKRGLMYWLNRPIGEVIAHATGAAHEEKASVAQSAPASASASLSERLVDEGEIGRGGMASVHRAFDKTLMRRVAMKILDPRRVVKESQRNRFIEEAQITGQLDHPNIPPVHEFGVDEEGTHYFTMKLVRGKTLDDILAEPTFSATNEKELFRVLQIFVKVCQAISFAHSRGVIHCDLKPSNVMVGSHGQVYVMDWGIARLVGRSRPSGADETWVQVRSAPEVHRESLDEASDSSQAKIMGTLQYMSPEQAQGRTDEIDERTDVFCLGAMLYKILTGRAPYAGKKQMEMFMAAARAEFATPQNAVSGVTLPERLCQIAMKAMSRDPADRYQNVDELQEDVEAFMRGDGRFLVMGFEEGELIIREGETGDAAYVVVNGRCRVFKTIDGEKRIIREMGPGSVFGETAVLTSQPRSASVEAIEPCNVLVVTRDSLEREIGQSLWMGQFLKALAERFRDVDAVATRARQEADEAVAARVVLQHVATRGLEVDGRRGARWSTVRDALAEKLGREGPELVGLVRRIEGVVVDEARDLVTLAPASDV